MRQNERIRMTFGKDLDEYTCVVINIFFENIPQDIRSRIEKGVRDVLDSEDETLKNLKK